MQPPITRTYRGPTPESAAEAYRADAVLAQAAGYVPVSHRWSEQDADHMLTVRFRLGSELAQPGPGALPGGETDMTDGPPPASAPHAGEPAADVVVERSFEADSYVTHDFEPRPTPAAARTVEARPAPEVTVAPAADRPAADGPPADEAVSRRHELVAVQVLDMHCGGEPLRIVRSGFPDVPLQPVLERRRWVAEHADHVRRAIIHEPRGHRDMYAAVLLPPYRADADICLLFMHNEGYSTMCGHGVIAVTTALVEEGLYPVTEPVTTIRYEVPAGVVTASASVQALPGGGHVVDVVRFTNVPSFLAARSLDLRPDGVSLHGRAAESGHLGVDLAFGGAYYGIVDAAQLGLRVVPEQAADLRRAGAAITDLLRRDHTPSHPTDDDLSFVYGTIIVDLDPASSPDGRGADAHLRNATIFADAELDRSPCGSGTSAILAQLHARGRMEVGQELVNASITGEQFLGRIESETSLGGERAVVTSVAGTAYVTGYGTLVVDERDPLGEGFLLT